MKPNPQHLACAAAFILIAACSGGGGGEDRPTPPDTPTLNVAFGVKELRFSWSAVSTADFYRLFENPDGVSGFTQLGSNLTALSFNHAISVHRRVNASYRLEACSAAGCTASAVVTPGTTLAQAIGYVKASNPGADDEFGVSVALSADGSTLAVGAWMESSGTLGINTTPNDSAQFAGAVYVFSRGTSGWAQEAYIKPLNTSAGDGFGLSIALSADGNTLAVGAWNEDSSSTGVNNTSNELATNSGAAYVFTRSAGVWTQQAYIKASNTAAGDNFGMRVALSGDGITLAVGARSQDGIAGGGGAPGAPDSGAVYVFTRSGTAWSQQAIVRGSNTGPGDGFGSSVALSSDGNTMAVGADQEDSGSMGVNTTPDETAIDSGAAYIFTRSMGVWSEQAYLKPFNTGAGDRFGGSVALSGDGNTVVVGASQEDSSTTGVNSTPNESSSGAGAAYIFTRTGSSWSQQAYLKASNAGAQDFFGVSVALSADGSTIAVGADSEDSSTTGVNSTPNNAALDAGAVYLFTRSGTVWSQQAYLKASNTGADDRFGFGVALNSDGSTVAVGAEGEDSSTSGIGTTPNESTNFAGAVYLY